MSRYPKPSRRILGPNDCLLVLGLCSFSLIMGCQDSGTSLAPKPQETQTQQADSKDVAAQGSETVASTERDPAKSVPDTESTVELSKPISLLDGETLDFWEEIEFGGEGAIEVEDGVISFEMGDPFTGIASTLEDLPKTNYEVSLETRKTQGVDFFCGLTFPVADSHCTLILGGWGGDICGLSCIDGKDASTNETTSSLVFEKNQWYKVQRRLQRLTQMNVEIFPHEHFMQRAFAQATAASELDEVPVGAVIVYGTRVIGAAHNLCQQLRDPTAHAEMLAITQAAEAMGDWRLEDCTLYVTLEPCPMCAGAILQARIPIVVYGARDPKAGAVESMFQLLKEHLGCRVARPCPFTCPSRRHRESCVLFCLLFVRLICHLDNAP